MLSIPYDATYKAVHNKKSAYFVVSGPNPECDTAFKISLKLNQSTRNITYPNSPLKLKSAAQKRFLLGLLKIQILNLNVFGFQTM